MLYNLNDEPMTTLPHADDYQLWRSNISDNDYDRIVADINTFVDNIDDQQSFISSYLPGQLWGSTPCQPLLDACGQSREQAGLFFGLIVWEAIKARNDEWYFKPADREDRDFMGKVYWRRNR